MAGSKTYIPGLRFVLGQAHKYGTRWQTQLAATLTEEQYNCLTSTLTAIAACLALLGKATPAP